MRKVRFTEEQMVAILREADRTTVAEAAKKNKVSEPTIYAWRKHFGQMDAVDVKRLRALETEKSCLKKLLAERDLGIEALKEIKVRRAQLSLAQKRGLSQRRACIELRGTSAREGCAGRRGNEGAVGAVPSLRLPPHPHLLAPTRSRAQLLEDAPDLASS